MNKVMRKMTINKLKVGDKIYWLKGGREILTVKKFSPCSEEWCKMVESFNYYKECERVRVLAETGGRLYVLCCKNIEVVKNEPS